jgi:hypothetical protein
LLRLYYSNLTEALLDALVRRVHGERASGDPLAPVWIVVPNRNVERYVELGIAQRLGIAVNLRFERLSDLVRRWLEKGDTRSCSETELRARVLRALLDDAVLAGTAMGPVRRYRQRGEGEEAIDLRRAQLALHPSRGSSSTRSRGPSSCRHGTPRARTSPKNTVRARRTPRPRRWQRDLWRAIRAHPRAPRTSRSPRRSGAPTRRPRADPRVRPLVRRADLSRVSSALGERADLYLYTLNPCGSGRTSRPPASSGAGAA